MKDGLVKGGDPNHRHIPHGLAPLHRLCQPNRTADRIEIAKLLLEHGTTIDIRSIARGSTPADVGGQTPLDLAAFNSCLELATFFLSRGADVHAMDDRDYTPLHFAAVGGDIKLAELLLEHDLHPGVNFTNVELNRVVAALGACRGIRPSAARPKGVNLVLLDPANANPTVTITLRNLSLKRISIS